ncbi:allantoinase [Paenibacillus cremeus]
MSISERFDLIVHGGLVVLPDRVAALDIGIRDGKIAALGESLASDADSTATRMLSAHGRYIMPGMVDAHVHFNEPGLNAWEGFATGSASLAAGGCTTYIDMPLNGRPPTVSPEALQLKRNAAHGRSYVDYALWGGLVPGNAEKLRPLAEAGVAGFKAFMSDPGGEGEDIFREVDDWTLYEGMRVIAELGGVLALHAESEPLVSRLAAEAKRAGRHGALDYAASRPVIAELEAVRRALFYAEQTGCALHFVHISSPQAVAAIDLAKRQGLDVTVETCPHYLTLTAEDMARLGPVAKCAPPLRTEEEQQGLWEALANGQIDLIASDHSPCPPDLKQAASGSWFEAWGGISGAQSSLELMVGEGFVKRGISLPHLARMLSENPAKRFGLPSKGAIRIGMDADLALLDLSSGGYTLTAEQLKYKHKQSPYVGRTFHCRVTATLLRGLIIYDISNPLPIIGECLGEWLPRSIGTASTDTDHSNSA